MAGGVFKFFLAVSALAHSWAGPGPDGRHLAFWISDGLGIGIPCLVILAFRRESRRDLGLSPPPWSLLLLCITLGAGLWVPLWALDSLRGRYLTDPLQVEAIARLLDLGWGGRTVVLLTVALAPAVFEELAFRGLLQPVLTAAWGTTLGILSTGLLFALFHMSPAQSVAQFALGCVLGWMRWRTGSLWPSVFCHARNNAITIVAIFRDPGFLGEPPAIPPLPWVAGGLALAALCAWALKRRTGAR